MPSGSLYRIAIDEKVLTEDFKSIAKADRMRILDTIQNKLSRAPQEFGKPLRGALQGYWRLRVGSYRVIYRIDEKTRGVTVVLIDVRRDGEVYEKANKRLV